MCHGGGEGTGLEWKANLCNRPINNYHFYGQKKKEMGRRCEGAFWRESPFFSPLIALPSQIMDNGVSGSREYWKKTLCLVSWTHSPWNTLLR